MRFLTPVQSGSMIQSLRMPGANMPPQAGRLPPDRFPRGLRGVDENPNPPMLTLDVWETDYSWLIFAGLILGGLALSKEKRK